MNLFTKKYIIMLFLLPFIGIKNIDNIFILTYGMRFLVALIGYLMLFENLKCNKKKINNEFVLLNMLYSFIILSSALINKNLSFGMIFTCFVYQGFFIYINYCMKDFKTFIIAISDTFKLLFIYNIYLSIFSQDSYMYIGIEKVFIGTFSSKNAISMIVFPAIAFILIQSEYLFDRIRFKEVIFCFIGLLIIIISKSSTAVVIAGIFLIYIVFFIYKRIGINKLMILYSSIYIGLVIFRIHDILLGDFIVNILGKSTTLTGRTYIWDFVLGIIPKSLLVGYGRNDIILEESIIGGVTEAHNGFLEIILCTGLIGIIIFILILYLLCKKINKDKGNISYIIAMSIFLYLCIGLTESAFTYTKVGFWILIIIGININNISNQKCLYTNSN